MEIKELETQTEREMAAVILEQAIEIRKLRLALKAFQQEKQDRAKKFAENAAKIIADTEDRKNKHISTLLKQHDWSAKTMPTGQGGHSREFPTIDPMAVDVRNVV